MGDANWEPIKELQKNLRIPVLGNGDCKNYTDGIQKMGNLGGFMIAR